MNLFGPGSSWFGISKIFLSPGPTGFGPWIPGADMDVIRRSSLMSHESLMLHKLCRKSYALHISLIYRSYDYYSNFHGFYDEKLTKLHDISDKLDSNPIL